MNQNTFKLFSYVRDLNLIFERERLEGRDRANDNQFRRCVSLFQINEVVSREVTDIPAIGGQKSDIGNKQLPYIRNGLRKVLYFFPGIQE